MKNLLLLITISIFLLNSCSQIKREQMDMVQESFVADSVIFFDEMKVSPETYISSSAAVENPDDSVKVIRTANVKFKVKDVIKATYAIENTVVNQGGYVENTNLENDINNYSQTPKSRDSMLITTYYTIRNTMILRVPSAKLDTTLKQIAQLVDFMDYRIISAKNVTLNLLSKQLEQSRLAHYNARMNRAIDKKGKKLDDISIAEENMLYRTLQADEAHLINFALNDSIKFSIINISIYQNQNIKKETVTLYKEYKTPFGTRFVSAVKFGWTIITEIFLFLINLWAIILLAVVIYFVIKFIRRKYLS